MRIFVLFTITRNLIFDSALHNYTMTKDARLLINKKKWNRSQRRDNNQRGPRSKIGGNVTDARKILTLKRSNFHRTSTVGIPSEVYKVKKSLPVHAKVPEKRVQLARDGNIWITAKAKNPHEVIKSQNSSKFGITRPKPSRIQWTPVDIDMDNLEHVGIDDVIDMESLPTSVVSSNPYKNRLMSSRSLAQDVLSMQNTMVADQIASTSAYQNACVIVANLQATVSKQDLMELFGDVGLVKAAEMKHPGTALIEFFSVDDASRACSTYHNRLLDGQPMHCYLQPSSINQRTSVSQRLGERVQNIIPVSYTSSPSNPRSRYDPQNVRFTVKLS